MKKSHITYQYLDHEGNDRIEISHDGGHNTFIIIEDDTITIHSSTALKDIRPHGAVNKIEVKIEK